MRMYSTRCLAHTEHMGVPSTHQSAQHTELAIPTLPQLCQHQTESSIPACISEQESGALL